MKWIKLIVLGGFFGFAMSIIQAAVGVDVFAGKYGFAGGFVVWASLLTWGVVIGEIGSKPKKSKESNETDSSEGK